MKAPWPKERDDALMELVSDGLGLRRAAHALGITVPSAVSRFRKLRKAMGPQAV